MAKKLTSAKAKEILHDKSVHGHPLTEQQRKFFGAIAGGAKPYKKAQLGGAFLAPITPQNVSDFFELFSIPQKAITKLISGKYQTPSEAIGIKNKAGAMATDILLDPLTLMGGGFGASKVSKATSKAVPKAAKAASKVSKVAAKPKIFKSEIDWAKWNSDTPKYPELINEYNTIEESTKKAGTWMKNPDGSSFKGTPEQFIQQQSSWFKKAFGNSKLVNPDGSPTFQYHGSAKKFDVFDESKFQLGDAGYSGKGIYTTPSKTTANSYATSSAKFHSGEIEPTVYQLYGQANSPIGSSQLIKENKGRDLFNFHRDRNWKGALTPEESLKQYDAAISDQLPNVQNVRPWHDAREIVFPTNKQLKSAVGNVGFFDMTNPNIYKAVVPTVIGTSLLQQNENPPKKQDGGWLDKYEQGGLVLKQKTHDNYGKKANLNDPDVSLPPGFKGLAYNTKGRNYSPAWGGQFAMGGSIPGAVGFTYARVAGSAPANGKYTKKTKASAQNGKEMKFYQEGLDFKPKTISQDGSEISIDPMGYWNPENWGNPVIIPSTDITMEGVDQPLIGISDTGDVQYMMPGEDYEFDGEYVTEYPVAKKGISVNKADAQPLKKLDQLLNFTNYNKPTKGGWLDKYN